MLYVLSNEFLSISNWDMPWVPELFEYKIMEYKGSCLPKLSQNGSEIDENYSQI